MIDLYSPRGEMELLILRSLLEDAGIPFYVRNDTFGSLCPGRYSEAYNRKTVCVPEAAREDARELVQEFLDRTGGSPPREPREEGPLDRLAATFHAFLDHWARRWTGSWRQRFPALRHVERQESPEELRRRFRVIRNDRIPGVSGGGKGPAGVPSPAPTDKPPRPPLRLV